MEQYTSSMLKMDLRSLSLWRKSTMAKSAVLFAEKMENISFLEERIKTFISLIVRGKKLVKLGN